MENSLEKLKDYYFKCIEKPNYKGKRREKYFDLCFDNVDPKYIDLIYKSVIDKQLSFRESHGFTVDLLSRTICLNFKNDCYKSHAFHELGHAVDFISYDTIQKGFYTKYKIHFHSNTDILSNGKTLEQTLKDELKKVGPKLYEFINSELKRDVLDKLPTDLMDKYYQTKAYFDEYKKLNRSLPEIMYKSYQLQGKDLSIEDRLSCINWKKHYKNKTDALKVLERREYLKSNFIDYKLYNSLRLSIRKSRQYSDFIEKYDILIDMAASYRNVSDLLPRHSYSYFKKDGRLGIEFFAECFSAILCKEDLVMRTTKEWLPNSIECFEHLIEELKL